MLTDSLKAELIEDQASGDSVCMGYTSGFCHGPSGKVDFPTVPFDIRVSQLPLTPPQLRRLIRAAQASEMVP